MTHTGLQYLRVYRNLKDIEKDRIFIKEKIFWGRNYTITNVACSILVIDEITTTYVVITNFGKRICS